MSRFRGHFNEGGNMNGCVSERALPPSVYDVPGPMSSSSASSLTTVLLGNGNVYHHPPHGAGRWSKTATILLRSSRWADHRTVKTFGDGRTSKGTVVVGMIGCLLVLVGWVRYHYCHILPDRGNYYEKQNLVDSILEKYQVSSDTIWWKDDTERLSKVYESRTNFSWCIPETTPTHDWR